MILSPDTQQLFRREKILITSDLSVARPDAVTALIRFFLPRSYLSDIATPASTFLESASPFLVDVAFCVSRPLAEYTASSRASLASPCFSDIIDGVSRVNARQNQALGSLK
ncbi:hypothetical protein NUW54_g1211 [Trametes sanguinea]|uniref:Uncharacterized protein n=1 Tax=Trametes sanguinea TaxID=158606 RepID=A0ACC1Q781_9APHY|nr:hypothetical protein NUW54_g1211 [Trametes sanguinea]